MENKNNKISSVANKVSIQLAALNPFVTTNLPTLTESNSGKGFVTYGDDNRYPDFLLSLYDNVSTLRSVIDGCVDYVVGEGVFRDEECTTPDESLTELCRNITFDYYMFGGFCVEVLRNAYSGISTVNYIPFERVRSNEDKTKFYYSEDWSKSYGRVRSIEIPAYDPNSKDYRSFYYYSKNRRGVYPLPLWNSAIKAALTESKVNEYWLNGISNGFSSSALISLNNGVPEDEQKQEIEKYFTEKFTGSENAGRILLSFSPDKEHAPDILTLSTEDFSEKYKACVDRAREEIFIAFRATSNLFGLQKEGIGFNTQEYADAYTLFNKTVITPVRNIIKRELTNILGFDIYIKELEVCFADRQ